MTTPINQPLQEIVLPVGWNALINHTQKVAIICGEYKNTAKAFTRLELINKPSNEALIASVEALGYSIVIPKKPAPIKPPAG